ncbi:hypothetical protein ACLMJK_009130 [Lecanora helva]
MRPHHLVLVCLGVIGLPTLLTFLSLLRAHPRGEAATESNPDSSKSGIRALFSFHTPSTLFPPSAIISLTDDNSTFFLARPADFGPSLKTNGLSAQLWIGSGFGDEGTGRGAPGSGAEGELGCSDVPGWEDGNQVIRRDVGTGQSASQEATKVNSYASRQSNSADAFPEDEEEPSAGDGTDDHLHHPLPSSPVSKSVDAIRDPPQEPGHPSTHADIQSLQESAEISGKIVLLSRGGCGFLEKVKWSQRRGASAVIVGDHTRGGALITMYARGDTSNVTIPSLFTSHTTAHLLSSLIPPTGPVDGPDSKDDKGSHSHKGNSKHKVGDDRPTFTPTSIPKSTIVPKNSISKSGQSKSEQDKKTSTWLQSLFGGRSKSSSFDNTRRPPSSGRLDWFSSERWTDESLSEREASSKWKDDSSTKSKAKTEKSVQDSSKTGSQGIPRDDFVIGVQDWRDPDLVAAVSTSQTKSTTTTSATAKIPLASKVLYRGESIDETAFSGGSITPGSGQYHKPGSKADVQHAASKQSANEDVEQSVSKSKVATAVKNPSNPGSSEDHEGLWITLTPTTMSTSPFFDTLLVLVVSPLVTLTVVYTLLLLRSRIRRRRWRAPKSVVERLPIRTYHTMSCASTTTSSSIVTPQTSSPTSPLLHSHPRSITARSRPRSVTATGIEEAVSASLDRATKASMTQQEKRITPSKSKKKYNGKQVECVVCLEEYIDGESKVMSLPCGHEFHADCITPWLTTRRRTCPICKGDVVRSMAQPPPGAANDAINSRVQQGRQNSADIQTQAAETTNESPSAAIPIPRDIDLEQGDDMAATLVNDEDESSVSESSWRGLSASMSLSAFSGEAAWRQAQENRNR